MCIILCSIPLFSQAVFLSINIIFLFCRKRQLCADCGQVVIEADDDSEKLNTGRLAEAPKDEEEVLCGTSEEEHQVFCGAVMDEKISSLLEPTSPPSPTSLESEDVCEEVDFFEGLFAGSVGDFLEDHRVLKE